MVATPPCAALVRVAPGADVRTAPGRRRSRGSGPTTRRADVSRVASGWKTAVAAEASSIHTRTDAGLEILSDSARPQVARRSSRTRCGTDLCRHWIVYWLRSISNQHIRMGPSSMGHLVDDWVRHPRGFAVAWTNGCANCGGDPPIYAWARRHRPGAALVRYRVGRAVESARGRERSHACLWGADLRIGGSGWKPALKCHACIRTLSYFYGWSAVWSGFGNS